MTDTAARPGATEVRAQNRRLLSRIPLWVRVSGIIALILTGVLLSSMLLGALGADEGQRGGHSGRHGGTGGQLQTTPQGGSGSSHGSSGSHGSGGSHDSRGDHGSGGDR